MYILGFLELASKQLKQLHKKSPLASHAYRFLAQSVLTTMASGALSPLEVNFKVRLSIVRQCFRSSEVRFVLGLRMADGFAAGQLKETLSRSLTPTYVFLL